MDDLNKNQLILLALLVSFVTSIATGIATVSLLDEAPTEVTRVINRVVERTVETVSPRENVSAQDTGNEDSILIQDELITESIAKNLERIVGVYNDSGTFLGRGVIVSESGAVLVTSPPDANDTVVRTHSGVIYPVRTVAVQEGGSLALLQIESDELPKLNAATYPEGETLKLGQTVIALSGQENAEVSLGSVSRLFVEDVDGKQRINIETTINYANLVSGSTIINLSGNVVAVVSSDKQAIIPFTDITSFLQETGE